jgi:hypothetical protein
MLVMGNHKDRVELTPDEMDIITLWLDLNSPNLGAYHGVGEQNRGELIWPDLE